MNYIIVIYGVDMAEYEATRDDLTRQFKDKGIPVPFFAHLSSGITSLEVVFFESGVTNVLNTITPGPSIPVSEFQAIKAMTQ